MFKNLLSLKSAFTILFAICSNSLLSQTRASSGDCTIPLANKSYNANGFISKPFNTYTIGSTTYNSIFYNKNTSYSWLEIPSASGSRHITIVMDINNSCLNFNASGALGTVTGDFVTNYGFCLNKDKTNPYTLSSTYHAPLTKVKYNHSNVNVSALSAARIYYLMCKYPDPNVNIDELQSAVWYFTRGAHKSTNNQGSKNTYADEAIAAVPSVNGTEDLVVFYSNPDATQQNVVMWKCISVCTLTGNTNICVGGTTNLSSSASGGTWSSSNTSVATVNSSGVVTGVSVGTATITYTSASAVCKTIVTVNALPVVAAITGSNTIICKGATTTYTSTTAGGVWSSANTSIATVSSTGIITGIDNGTTAINYTVTNAAGCQTTVSRNITVTSPSCNFTVNNSTQNLAGNSFVFTISSPVPGTTYTWNFGDGSPTVTGNSVTKSYTGAGSYLVTVTANNGTCSATCNTTVHVSGAVGGGGDGGVESKSLGDIIGYRTYNKAQRNQLAAVDYSTLTPISFKQDDIAVNNTGGTIRLANLMPTQLTTAGFNAYQVSPTDLIGMTNANEVIAIDFTQDNQARAVAFATRTAGEVYNHTKQICERLRGAELLKLEPITVKGISMIRYTLRQENGNVEYAVSFSAGARNGRNNFTIQSNWLTKDFVNDETMYNFQLWAANTSLLDNMLNDVMTKLNNIMPLTATGTKNGVLPKVYVSSGKRSADKLALNIVNNTNTTSGYVELTERKNENVPTNIRRVNFNMAANGKTTITVPVSDYYEAGISIVANNVEEDLLYLADGMWGVAYGNNTTIRSFEVSNDENRKFTNDAYPLMRNATINAVSKDYVSVYKLLRGGAAAENLTAYQTLNFNASGAGKLKITLVKKSITDWSKQYTYTLPLNGTSKDYSIRLSDFAAQGTTAKIKADDVLQVIFTIEAANSNSGAIINTKFSNVEFAKAAAVTVDPVVADKDINIFPNPSTNGRFAVSFEAAQAQNATLKLVDAQTGRVILNRVFTTTVGKNIQKVEVTNLAKGSQATYMVVVETTNGAEKYKTQKAIVHKQ